MGSRYIRIDRSSRQLLRGTIPASFRLPVIGPYVTSVGGLTRAQRDCVLQRGVWVSRDYHDGERDREMGEE